MARNPTSEVYECDAIIGNEWYQELFTETISLTIKGNVLLVVESPWIGEVNIQQDVASITWAMAWTEG